ncbi:MAG: Sec-dependent nitrous-oxide reductase [Opitutaceae bacterium]
MNISRHLTSLLLGAGFAGMICGCSRRSTSAASYAGESNTAAAVIAARHLEPADVVRALSTFVPPGRHDPYIMFASGGQNGQVLVYGIPSMRLLTEIPVFSPDSMAGWGYGGDGNQILEEGDIPASKLGPRKVIRWGDLHHCNLSETNGTYDGQWLFANDKANGRIAVVDLRDFATKQIVKNPLFYNDHGAVFVTPNTTWLIETSQYSAPLGGAYRRIADYDAAYRGEMTFWRFDRQSGRIDPRRSFAVELPPYWQDLAISGKLISHGWVFCNSFNVARYHGDDLNGEPSFEAGATSRDTDYLHIINLNQAAREFAAGKFVRINGFPMITLKTAIADHILFFTPETKSPHGVDVTPDGRYIVVSGKLDPHVTVYGFQKIQAAIAKGTPDHDDYGVPVLSMEDTVVARVEVGLGPLHTQFDDRGFAYTTLFLDSAIAKWSIGGPAAALHPGVKPWTLVQKLPVQYNPGHLAVIGGDTTHPTGRYLLSLNKWSIDRFNPVGPLYPENLQLIDISGDRMRLLSDTPLGLGETHYAQIIAADALRPWTVYPQDGWDAATQSVDPDAAAPGNEGVIRQGRQVTVKMTIIRSHFTPEIVRVEQGDEVTWRVTNIERTPNATHGLAISAYNINLTINPGQAETIHFVADRAGVFSFYCTKFCSALHLEMAGYLIVKPAAAAKGGNRS